MSSGKHWILILLVAATGCTSVPVHRASASPINTDLAERPLVLVIDGAGGFHGASHSLRAAADCDAPFEIETFRWSHGYLRVLADHVHRRHAVEQGRVLAEQIEAHQREHPGRTIHLVAHSAGAGVALAAGQFLSPDSLGRIILLSPAVSEKADIRPALAVAREGMDVFYSKADWGYLGIATAILGTTDRCWRPAAGRVGFKVDYDDPADAALLERLRQHPWDTCVAWTGNLGGHFGVYQRKFMCAYVLPLLAPPARRPLPPGDYLSQRSSQR